MLYLIGQNIDETFELIPVVRIIPNTTHKIRINRTQTVLKMPTTVRVLNLIKKVRY
jgi:hypothetical protein